MSIAVFFYGFILAGAVCVLLCLVFLAWSLAGERRW